MKEKIIDPSEILLDNDGTIHEKPLVANPWVRFLARMFDYSLFFLLLLGLRTLLRGPLPTDRVDSFIPLEYFLWIPIEALLLWNLKTTPGKFWFRISLRQGRLSRLEFLTALRRSFHVWIRGIGFGIPIINGLCMMVAYHRLKLMQITSWDRDDHVQVSHLPISQSRLVAGILIALGGAIYYTSHS